MTDTAREAAIERVRAYVDAWSVYKDSAVACMRDDAPLILGDLRALLALAAPVEGGVAEAVLKDPHAVFLNMMRGGIAKLRTHELARLYSADELTEAAALSPTVPQGEEG